MPILIVVLFFAWLIWHGCAFRRKHPRLPGETPSSYKLRMMVEGWRRG